MAKKLLKSEDISEPPKPRARPIASTRQAPAEPVPIIPKWKNTLYFGDNLDVLRRYIPDDSVDLVYLDPPFNSDQNYNVLFAEQDGKQSAAPLWQKGLALAEIILAVAILCLIQ